MNHDPTHFGANPLANYPQHCEGFVPMTVDSLLILPCSTPDFEAGIWSAVIDKERDWTDTEKEYLRRNHGIRESIMQWAEYNYSDGCWTIANLELLRPYWKASTKDLPRPGADSLSKHEDLGDLSMLSINTKYVQERVHRYNDRPSDDLLYRIGSHADVLEPGESNGQLNPEQRFRILNWILCQGYEIKGDLALLIFGREQLEKWLGQSRQAYPDFEFYLAFEFLEEEDTGWESGIYYSLWWHPKPGSPMPSSDCDFPWRLYWDGGDAFWGDFPDNTKNDIEFTLSVYPNQQSFTAPGWVCEEGDRYCSFTDEEADLMPVAEVLKLFA